MPIRHPKQSLSQLRYHSRLVRDCNKALAMIFPLSHIGVLRMRILNCLLLVTFCSFGVSLQANAQEASVRDRALADPNPVSPTLINKELTSIDRYVAAPDSTYRWDLVNSQVTPDGTMFVIDLKSQTWLRPDEVNRTLWQHWLTIFKPAGVTSNKALMFIGGGGNSVDAPNGLDARVAPRGG